VGGKVSVSDLIAGDIFLYQGQGFLSSMIRLLDGEPYSHASIYMGKDQDNVPRVAEMLGNGVNVRNVATSVSSANYVDAYRYVNADHEPLGSPTVDPKPLVDKIGFFTSPINWQRYGYEQILLLAMLCSTRRVPGVAGEVIRRVLDSASEVLAQLIHAGQEPMICSELVYRCYTEASPSYELLILGSDTPNAQTPYGMLANHPVEGTPSFDDVATERAIATFLANYSLAKGRKGAVETRDKLSGFAPLSATVALSMLAVADFVTPNDLSKSPNFQKLGTLSA